MKERGQKNEEVERVERRHRRGKDAKLIALAAALMVLAFFIAFYFGGTGGGAGQGDNTTSSDGGVTRSIAESAASSDVSGSTVSIPAKVTVRIEENSVTVEGHLCEDAAALKAYIESIHNDSRTYQLEEKNSILAVHEWVIAVFEELRIPLTQG